jgi:hypothetical protein
LNVVRQSESDGGETLFDHDRLTLLGMAELASIVGTIALGAQVLDRETMLRHRPGDSFKRFLNRTRARPEESVIK